MTEPTSHLIAEARDCVKAASAWLDKEPDAYAGPVVVPTEEAHVTLDPETEWIAWACQNSYYVRRLIADVRELVTALEDAERERAVREAWREVWVTQDIWSAVEIRSAEMGEAPASQASPAGPLSIAARRSLARRRPGRPLRTC